MRMIKSGKFNDKKILLIDKEPKTKNDRTWCFWEKQEGFFEEIVYKRWDKLSFFSDEYSNTMDISPYQYKMIRGIDFYNYCFDEIKKNNNINIIYGKVNAGYWHKEGITIKLDDQVLEFDHSEEVFNSFLSDDVPNTKEPGKDITLLQHFKGWMIETDQNAFDPGAATFMDFRVKQDRGTAFAYALPFTGSKALIEYTLFSENVLKDEEYERGLETYIKDILKINNYRIVDTEFGVIPMTTKKFKFYSANVYHIGTIGGQTKASTGYTFQFIQKQSEYILEYLMKNKALFEIPPTPKRFLFYDKILLNVLHKKRALGKQIFSTMFKKNKPQQVLKFLDNESSLSEELKIISTLPTLPFLKAAINQF